jgi:hypothetical protein
MMDNLDKALIDKHFQFAELSRSYSPSGIYLKVQHYIDNGLAADREGHDSECEHRSGNPYLCRCQDRRGYDFKDQPDGSVVVIPRLT